MKQNWGFRGVLSIVDIVTRSGDEEISRHPYNGGAHRIRPNMLRLDVHAMVGHDSFVSWINTKPTWICGLRWDLQDQSVNLVKIQPRIDTSVHFSSQRDIACMARVHCWTFWCVSCPGSLKIHAALALCNFTVDTLVHYTISNFPQYRIISRYYCFLARRLPLCAVFGIDSYVYGSFLASVHLLVICLTVCTKALLIEPSA